MEQEKTVKMKQITLTILIGIFALNVSAQDIDAPSKHEAKGEDLKLRSDGCPAIYITTSTGINNNTAILGFNFELPVSEKVAIEAGPGTGTWGYKAYAGVKYYLKPCQRGFAFGTGLTYCPGVQHSWHDVATIYGSTEDIEFKKNAQTNILFAAYKYWTLGKKYNRVYAELGWSVPLSSGDKLTQLSGDPVSSDGKSSVESSAPGGPVVAVGISFGVH